MNSFLVLALFITRAASASSSPLDSFLAPVAGASASGGELGPLAPVASAEACASACLQNSACISFSLLSGDAAFQTCGVRGECYGPNASSCPAVLRFGCYGGTFSSVGFAAYGSLETLPGQCAWAHNASCDSPNAGAVFAAACVGKASCSVEISVATFGADPCPGVYKFAAASLVGSCSAPPQGTMLCGMNGYARDYTISAGGNASALQYYQRLQPRNDAPAVQAVPYLLDVPVRGVTIDDGVLRTAFENGILYLTQHYTVDDILYDFRRRAGNASPPGACHGWDCTIDWIEGSIAGLFLMGAGGHLRWTEHAQLREMMDAVIDGIENCTESDGYLAAFPQIKLATDEHPDYTTSWTVHGFLEAHIAGNPKALRMM